MSESPLVGRPPGGLGSPAIAVIHLAAGEFLDLLNGPFAREVPGDDLGTIVVVPLSDGTEVTEAHLEALAILPAIVLGVGDAGPHTAGAAMADLVVAPGDAEERVISTIVANPLAATALALLLRSGGGRSVAEGLIAESATYSTLQGGPEFASWRAGRRVRAPTAVDPDDAVRWERTGGRMDVVLSRPAVHNAYNTAMRDGLFRALAAALDDPSVTEIHLRGAGPSFCSGGDLDEFGSRPDPATAHLVRLARCPAWLVHQLESRITVHLRGACMGSGIELSAFAGRVVAAPDTRIGLPEVGLGLIPGAGGTASLPRRIGRHRTAALALSGSTIDVATALDWGLVDAIEPG